MAGFSVTMKRARLPRGLTTVTLGLGLALAGATTATAQTDPSQELALRYAPVVRLVTQTEECGPGEPYEPTNVDVLLGNPDVAVRGPWAGNDLIKIAPTGNDL